MKNNFVYIAMLCLFMSSNAFATATCTSADEVNVTINGEQKKTISCSSNGTKLWENVYDDAGRKIYAIQYQPSGDEWVVKEIEKSTYEGNVRILQNYFCNGYRTGSMWGVVYVGPTNGCREQPFIQKVTNGSVNFHLDCASNPNHSECVKARGRYCTPFCATCGDSGCATCYRGYLAKDGTCIHERDGCGNGYAIEDGQCVEVKTRYTMQEADALTTNDNNNWIEWTFE